MKHEKRLNKKMQQYQDHIEKLQQKHDKEKVDLKQQMAQMDKQIKEAVRIHQKNKQLEKDAQSLAQDKKEL